MQDKPIITFNIDKGFSVRGMFHFNNSTHIFAINDTKHMITYIIRDSGYGYIMEKHRLVDFESGENNVDIDIDGKYIIYSL